MDLSAETAVVTGASRGIGLAIASTLAQRGASVAVWARHQDRVAAAADSIAGEGSGRTAGYAVDVRRGADVDEAAAAVASSLGPITLLVNNAGTAGPAGPEWDGDPDEWWRCVETSVRGSFLCARAVLPDMLDRGGGRIVETVSITGASAFPLISATSVAEAALIRHVENLAAATAGSGVGVFALHPGTVDTQLLASYRSHPEMAAFLDGLPEDGYASPELAAEAVARIAAGDLDALSGCVVDATTDLDALLGDKRAWAGLGSNQRPWD